MGSGASSDPELLGLRRAQDLAPANARRLFDVARCTMTRLMREIGLQGVIRGKSVKTHDRQRQGAERSMPARSRQSPVQGATANLLWLSDFTYVATWTGFVYVAFVIDVFARKIVGWHSAHSTCRLRTRCPGAGLHDPRPLPFSGELVHSDRAANTSPFASPSAWLRLAIEPSVGSARGCLRQRCSPKPSTVSQGRGDPSARAMEQLRRRGIRHSRMGRLVQQPTASSSRSATSRQPKPSNDTTP